MTDNQDSVSASAVQPPTDRPLTAGDVALLREGDVLRVVDPHPNTHAVGDLVTVVRTIPVSSTDEWIRIVWDGNEVDQYPHRFTFVSRPATSAASEVEGDDLVGAATSALNFLNNAVLESGVCCCGDPISGHTVGSGHSPVDDLAYHSSQIASRLQAALASPPVSERERELEAEVARLRDVLLGIAESDHYRRYPKQHEDGGLRGQSGLRAVRALTGKHGSYINDDEVRALDAEQRRALTAQPAGEGK